MNVLNSLSTFVDNSFLFHRKKSTTNKLDQKSRADLIFADELSTLIRIHAGRIEKILTEQI